jgi:hypothetical protein
MTVLKGLGVGEPGFCAYVRDLDRLGVVSRDERLAWIRLHGAVLRCMEPALENEQTFDEAVFLELKLELEAS